MTSNRILLLDVLVPYEVSYIARRGRVVLTETVADTMSVQIRTPGPGEVRIAFRIHSVNQTRADAPKVETRDVISFNGTLWWPINPDCRGSDVCRNPSVDEDLSEEEFLRILKLGTDDVLGIGVDHASKTRQLALRQQLGPLAREVKRDDREAAMTLVQRRVRELITWNGKAYGRGGEPTYVQPPPNNSCDYCQDGVASIGADRSVEPSRTGLALDVGRFEFGQRAFMYGKFQRADAYDSARAGQCTTHVSDRIDVLMPEAMKLNRGEVRLDALYRAAGRAISRRNEVRWADLRDRFTGNSKTSASGTSRVRFDALLEFARAADNHGLLPIELDEIYRCFLAFDNSPDRSELGSLLAQEDEDALASFAP